MPTLQTPTKLMTAEEFYDWSNHPDNRHRDCDLVCGVIVEMSRPGKRHGLVCANVTRILGNYVVSRGKGYVCSNDTGILVLRNPDTVRGPDVLLFDEVGNLDDVEVKYGEKPPVLAVEVLSPNDTHGTIMRRVRELLRIGTKLVWVLDPDARNVVVHEQGGDKVVEEDEDLTGEAILDAFQCRVAEFFDLPGQPRPATPSVPEGRT